MSKLLFRTLLLFAMLWPVAVSAGPALCLSCHDFGPDANVHPMLASKHGDPANADSPMGKGGCVECHGNSEAHTQAPLRTSPDVSFGPRWGAEHNRQNKQCLACHQQDIAQHWQQNVHQKEDLNCAACHKLHTTTDAVLHAQRQAGVCADCHAEQVTGIHAVANHEQQPDCASCHNPHADTSAKATLLATRSAGCASCHDLVTMAKADSASKAANYHKVMQRPDRSCLDCHQQVAHKPLDNPRSE